MRTSTLDWGERSGWIGEPLGDAGLVLWFASPALAPHPELFEGLKALFPAAVIAGCSSGSEITGGELQEGSAVAVAIAFDSARVVGLQVALDDHIDHAAAGRGLAGDIAGPDLKAVFILADGVETDGDALIDGLQQVLAPTVVVAGGLAASRDRQHTPFLGLDGPLEPGRVVCIGLYGDALRVGWGSEGGWDGFGPARRVTRSVGKVLYELDGQPALDLYKAYLGEAADRLPLSASLFPLMIRPEPDSDFSMVRAVLGVDEAERSLTFAGTIPEGWSAQLMHGGLDRLADGAGHAAQHALAGAGGAPGDSDILAVVVSCVGRKRVMGQRLADEVEAIAEAMGGAPTIGFYSFGEICPHGLTGRSTLHNQTMTLTILREAA